MKQGVLDKLLDYKVYQLSVFDNMEQFVLANIHNKTWSGFMCNGFFLSDSNIKLADSKYPLDQLYHILLYITAKYHEEKRFFNHEFSTEFFNHVRKNAVKTM